MKIFLSQYCNPKFDKIGYKEGVSLTPPSQSSACSPRGKLPHTTDRDAHRNFQKKPLKVTILGVAPVNFIA